MGKSLKITESQLKRLIKFNLNEQQHYKANPVKEGFKMMDIVNEQLDPTQQLGKWVMQGGKWIWKNILNPNVRNNPSANARQKQSPPPSPPNARQKQSPPPSPPNQQAPIPVDQKSVVGDIQTQLNSLGFLNVKPTGFYGPKTKEAVMKWQQSVGIKPDGYFIKGRDNVKLGNLSMGNIPRIYYQPPAQKPTPVQKPAPVAQRDTTKMSTIPSRSAGNVGVQQSKPDTISTDYRSRQGNY